VKSRAETEGERARLGGGAKRLEAELERERAKWEGEIAEAEDALSKARLEVEGARAAEQAQVPNNRSHYYSPRHYHYQNHHHYHHYDFYHDRNPYIDAGMSRRIQDPKPQARDVDAGPGEGVC
jgi:hypothetical protein